MFGEVGLFSLLYGLYTVVDKFVNTGEMVWVLVCCFVGV